jgi:hypothetical protein
LCITTVIIAPGACGRGSRATADDTASGGTAGTGACPKQAFGPDQTQFCDSGIDSGVILGSILIYHSGISSVKRHLLLEISCFIS